MVTIAQRENFQRGSERSCLSYWFPRIEEAQLPVPRTIILRCDPSIINIADNEPWRDWHRFNTELRAACDLIGWPVFLRTGQTSNKHGWQETCCVSDPEKLGRHVYNLVEFSARADIMGLPCDVWAVREMLPTIKRFTAFYGQMPICREFRFFVHDGDIRYWNPYWPKFAIEEGFPYEDGAGDTDGNHLLPDDWDDVYYQLCSMSAGETNELHRIASTAGAACGGDWSVDIIETERGWFLTDMAAAECSYGFDEARFR